MENNDALAQGNSSIIKPIKPFYDIRLRKEGAFFWEPYPIIKFPKSYRNCDLEIKFEDENGKNLNGRIELYCKLGSHRRLEIFSIPKNGKIEFKNIGIRLIGKGKLIHLFNMVFVNNELPRLETGLISNEKGNARSTLTVETYQPHLCDQGHSFSKEIIIFTVEDICKELSFVYFYINEEIEPKCFKKLTESNFKTANVLRIPFPNELNEWPCETLWLQIKNREIFSKKMKIEIRSSSIMKKTGKISFDGLLSEQPEERNISPELSGLVPLDIEMNEMRNIPAMNRCEEYDKFIELLIHGIDFHRVDLQRRTILHYAFVIQNITVVQHFLNLIVDNNAYAALTILDNEFHSPIHLAILTDNGDLIQMILDIFRHFLENEMEMVVDFCRFAIENRRVAAFKTLFSYFLDYFSSDNVQGFFELAEINKYSEIMDFIRFFISIYEPP